jgi:hypothetical protein
MELFISYAREDEAYRKELRKHLSGLLRQKVITDWHDRKIVAGQDWGREISAHLQAASIVVLLVSPDFMGSDYCWEREMAHALAMGERGDAVVIPVIIRPVDLEDAPFSHLQALPTDARPVSTWNNHDEAWVDVVKGIRTAISRFQALGALTNTSVGTQPTRELDGTDGERARPDPQPSHSARPVLEWLGEEGEELRSAFTEVFRGDPRPFGSRAMQSGGLSDGREGVQWNAGYDIRTATRWMGVNLEGLQYRGWPVARLIERELRSPTLPALVRRLGVTDPVTVWWTRDYWQAASRPEIAERFIAPTPIFVSRLTEDLWVEALREAAACLDAGGRGRGMQEVTLAKSGKRVVGPVSPHLSIAFPIPGPVNWREFLTRGKTRLQPFYDWAIERSSTSAPAHSPGEAHPGDRVRITQPVYSNAGGNRGLLAKPGQIATVLKWINAGAMRVRLDDDGSEFLLHSVQSEPL